MTAPKTPRSVPADAARRERFRLVYDAVYDDLWRYVQRRSVSDSEAGDTLAEVLLIAWRKLDEAPSGEEMRPWLFGVARNQLRSGWRRRKRTAALIERLSAELLTAPGRSAATDGVDPIAATQVLEAMGSLREADREVIRLAAWEELPHREIAAILGCSENAVAIRLHRARRRLSKAIDRARRGSRPAFAPGGGES